MTATIPRPAALDRLVDHVAAGLARSDERTLFVTAVRWALAHGWEHTHNRYELGLPATPARFDYQRWSIRIEWDGFATPDGILLWITKPHQFGDLVTTVRVGSVQQAVDVLAALAGQGHHLTTAGREAAQLRAALAQETAGRRAAEADAYTDELTGLDNRRRLRQVYRSVSRQGAACGLVMLDLDGFKQVNDAHGHDAGDEVLIEVSRRLVDADPSGEDLIVRLGGDEFAILTESSRAASVARRAWQVIRDYPVADLPDGAAVDVCASVGAVASTAGMTFAQALRAADVAMYAAKQEGGVVWHHPGMPMPTPRGRRRVRDAGEPLSMEAAA